MPIYAYKCEACGFAKDVLQKMSDAPLQDCPTCGKSSFRKQVTAAGFQLKGSGWYATDFKGGTTSTGAAAPAGTSTEGGSTAASGDTATSKADSTPAAPATPAAG